MQRTPLKPLKLRGSRAARRTSSGVVLVDRSMQRLVESRIAEKPKNINLAGPKPIDDRRPAFQTSKLERAAALFVSRSMFSVTKRFRAAVELVNGLDQKRFGKVLNRVVPKLGDQKAEKIFTASEEEQLCTILDLEQEQLDMVLSLSKYVFEQAAYFGSGPDKLSRSLQDGSMSEELATIFALVWKENRAPLTKKLQQFTLGMPNVLKGVDWRFQLRMASQGTAKAKDLNAVLNLTIGKAGGSGAGDAPAKDTDVTLELDKDGLVDLYNKLEAIQKQIDVVTKS